jgi:hypothetical protein
VPLYEGTPMDDRRFGRPDRERDGMTSEPGLGEARPHDVALRLRRRASAKSRDEVARAASERIGGFLRRTYVLPREDARREARDWLTHFPKAAYMTAVESWRELADGRIEFTMRRLPTAD